MAAAVLFESFVKLGRRLHSTFRNFILSTQETVQLCRQTSRCGLRLSRVLRQVGVLRSLAATFLFVAVLLSLPKCAFAEVVKSSALSGSFKIELVSKDATPAPEALKKDILTSLRVSVGRRSSAISNRGSFRVSRIQPGNREVKILAPRGYEIVSDKNLRRIRFASGKTVSLKLALRCAKGFVARSGECLAESVFGDQGQPTFTGSGYAFYNTNGGRSNILTLFSVSAIQPMLLELFNENGDLLLQNELFAPMGGSSIELRTLVGNNSQGLLRVSSTDVSQGILEIVALSSSKEPSMTKSRQYLNSASPSGAPFRFAARSGEGVCSEVTAAKAFVTTLGEALRENIFIRIYSKDGRLERIEERAINNHQLLEYSLPIEEGIVEVTTVSGAGVLIDFLSPEFGCEQIL